jgi:hypothetical protein
MADMQLTYGFASGSGREAGRLFQETFPYRRYKIFSAIVNRVEETGTFEPSTVKW